MDDSNGAIFPVYGAENREYNGVVASQGTYRRVNMRWVSSTTETYIIRGRVLPWILGPIFDALTAGSRESRA